MGKKYNLSNIMRRAWFFVKTEGFTMSDSLKIAWKEVKEVKKVKKIIKLNVCGKETFTVNTITGEITGKTYHSKEWIKRNFGAKWNNDCKCWMADPEVLVKEFENMRYYEKYIVSDDARTEIDTDTDPIVNKELINRADGFYSENTHKSGRISYSFVG